MGDAFMARRQYQQMSLVEALLDGKKRKRKRLERLLEMHDLIDWSPVDELLAPINGSDKGADGYPPLCLFKGLLLSAWYDLSDPKLEDALADRLSFRKFCGFPLDVETPDETTFVRFRKALRERGLFEKLFEAINQQFDKKGLFVKRGALIDATIVDADAKRPNMSEGQVSMVDPDATFTKKNDDVYFGYKMHVGVDEGSTLIRLVTGTTASIHDSLVFRGLVSGDETFVCADKAYGSEEHRQWLKDNNIQDRLMYKAQKNKMLTSWQTWFNKSVSSVRSGVERIFGVGKRSYGLGRARYRGTKRVEGHFFVIAMAYNLRRAITIVTARDALVA
jgi:IS5 family transposase